MIEQLRDWGAWVLFNAIFLIAGIVFGFLLGTLIMIVRAIIGE